MRLPLALPVLSLLVVTLFAGCAAEPEPQSCEGADCSQQPGPSAQPGTVSETTGAIEGLVVDDSIQPIVGALVGIQEPATTATTDVAGAFTFSSLAPGRYIILANALGYQAASKAVEVVAGEIVSAQIMLSPLPTAVPFPETLQFTGLIECGWGLSGAGTGNCLPIQSTLQQNNIQNPTNTRIIGLFRHSDPASVVEGIFEMTWDPSAATTAAELSLNVELEQTGIVGGKNYGRADGESPLWIKTTEEPWTDLTTEATSDEVQTRTFPAARTPPTLVVNQRFTVYATACHFAECGDMFTALADA